jgi:hypothetical protein
MIKRQRRFKRSASRFERSGLLGQARRAAAHVAEIFENVGALIGSVAIIAIQIRRDRRDRRANRRLGGSGQP